MMKLPLLSLLLPLAMAANLPKHHKELVDKFGAENVNFDRNVRTQFCDTCMEITVESRGGAQEHQPNRWEDTLVTVPCGRTWFHSGQLITNSTFPPTPCPTLSSTTSSGLSQKQLVDLMQA